MRRPIAIRCLLAALIIGCSSGTALAQTIPNPTGLTEADIAPCKDLLSVRIARYKERSDLSNLDFALTAAPYNQGSPDDHNQDYPDNLADTRESLKIEKEVVEILEARDEVRMVKVIGKIFQGQEYADRLALDRRRYCMGNVRVAQLTGSKPKPPAQSKAQSPAAKSQAPQSAAKPQAAAGDTAFQSNLKTFEADQLFAMASDFVHRGELDKAKLARNALLARFPDSTLVPAVVQLLASHAQPAAPAADGQSVADVNGIWRGDTSANEVRMELRPEGIYVVAVTNNAGQSAPVVYKPAGPGEYHYVFPDGKPSIMKFQQAGVLRLTNPDGWTDVFRVIRRN